MTTINFFKASITYFLMLICEVAEIQGKCPVYNLKDMIYIKEAVIDLKKTSKVCIHSLPSILHYAVTLREGINPKKLGLSKDGKAAYVQCLDPGEPYTQGGTVIFKIWQEKDENYRV